MASEQDNSSKSIFDLTGNEIEKRMGDRLDELRKEIFAKGLPLTYQDDRCPDADHYIREYEDGRIYLAFFDAETQAFRFVKDLTHG